jgi:hypothetical protein
VSACLFSYKCSLFAYGVFVFSVADSTLIISL